MTDNSKTLHRVETRMGRRRRAFLTAIACFTIGFITLGLGYRRGWTEDEVTRLWLELVTFSGPTLDVCLNAFMWIAHVIGFAIIVPVLLEIFMDSWLLEKVLDEQKAEVKRRDQRERASVMSDGKKS